MQLPSNDEMRRLLSDDPRKFIAHVYPVMEKLIGNWAERALEVYGDGAKRVDDIPQTHLLQCATRFALFLDHKIPTYPPMTDKPVVARNQLEADVARLKFKEAKRERAAKARQLWNALNSSKFDYHWQFDAVASSDKNYRRSTTYKMFGALCADAIAATDKDFRQQGYKDFRDYIITGLSRMTVGTFQKPCPLGLGELEFIMYGK